MLIGNFFKKVNLKYKKHYFSGIGPEDLVDYGVSKNDIQTYMSPSNEKLDEIGTEIHQLTDLIEEGFKKVSTNNKEQDLTIAEVLKSGYRRKLPNSDFQVITKAKVRVFVFEE